MAEIQNKTHNTKPKTTSYFVACFGFSSQKMSSEKVGSGGRKKTRLFSCSRFRMNNSGTKTVPFDATAAEKTNQYIENNQSSPTSRSKSKSKFGKLTSRRRTPDTAHKPVGQIPAVVPDQSTIENPPKTRHGSEESTILENRKNLDHIDSTKDATCQKRLSFSRKIESIRTGHSHPGSPETKPKPRSTAAAVAVLSHSVSFPDRNCEKRTTNTPAQSSVMLKKFDRKNDLNIEKLDPVIGMSIVMVTLIIMLLWGRLCAILCTSAWFYFIPRLRALVKSEGIANSNANSIQEDINSEEYKKKVVLEGFLERNHRSSFGIL